MVNAQDTEPSAGGDASPLRAEKIADENRALVTELEKYRSDRVVAEALKTLRGYLIFGSIVAGVTAIFGVRFSAQSIAEGLMRDAKAAEVEARAISRVLREQSSEADAVMKRSRETVTKVEQGLAELEGRLSSIDGDVDRSTAAIEIRVRALTDSLRALESALKTPQQKVKLEEIEKRATEESAAFQSRSTLAVTIVYLPSAAQRAKEFQRTLSRQGYVTQLLASDFSEIGGPQERGSVKVKSLQTDLDKAKQVSADLGLDPAAVGYASTLSTNNIRVWVF